LVMKTGASPRRLKHATRAHATSAATHATRGRGLAPSAPLESDALESMANVDKGVGEEFTEQRWSRIVEQPREVSDETLDPCITGCDAGQRRLRGGRRSVPGDWQFARHGSWGAVSAVSA
jgi:hypothetical protein